jgi:vacuolar-type H+-ATPase subunit H
MPIETVGFIVGLLVYTVGLIAGFFKILRNTEETIRTEVKNMHEAQDQRIREAERDAEEIRRNYEAKFRNVNDTANSNKIEMLGALHTLETNMRTSIHNLGDSVTKALNKFEVLINKAIGSST